MGDCSKKECSTTKDCKLNGSPHGLKMTNQNMRVVLVACAAAVTVICAWYILSSDPDNRNIADVTRPPHGFEIPSELADSHTDIFLEDSSDEEPITDHGLSQDSMDEKKESGESTEREKKLNALLREKDMLISELTRQLEESRSAAKQEVVNPEPQPPTRPESVGVPVTEPQPEVESGNPREHTVRKGETLSEISRTYYGASNRWQKIYEANQEKLSDKNRLRVGTVLVIPD